MNWKRDYFRRALLKKFPRRPPRRLPKLVFPARIEASYAKALDDYAAFVKSRIDARIKPMLPSLVEHYGRVRKDADESPQKYYSAFIFEKNNDAEVLHCTHHYLGELNRDDLRAVEKTIDAYFIRDRKLPRARFNRTEYFGPNKDIRVLSPDFPVVSDFLPDLKSKLQSFRKDDYPDYRPHVTTDAQEIDRPFSHYALISKSGIHRTWPKTVRMDAGDDNLQDLADELEKVRIETTQKFTPEELKRLAKITGESVEKWSKAQLNGQLAGIVEIDLFGDEPWLAREMGAFVVQNVSLITSIGDEYLGQVDKLVSTSVRSGLRAEEIAAEMEERFDVSKSRANLIARDQVGKFNGQLAELRQKDLGIEKYIRRGVGDARERDSHLILNNKTFTWDDPPEVGHPGEDIQCRCWAEPDLSEFYESDAS